MHLTLLTPPAVPVMSLDEAKAHLRVDSADEDDYIAGLIAAATVTAERVCDRAFLAQSWMLSLDAFPACRPIKVPRAPLLTVERVIYVDPDGAIQDLNPIDCQVSKRVPALIAPAPGRSWPATQAGRLDAVNVEFVAGYGAAATDVPAPIRHAVLLLAAHWFEHREPVSVGASVADLPFAVDALLAPYRVWSMA